MHYYVLLCITMCYYALPCITMYYYVLLCIATSCIPTVCITVYLLYIRSFIDLLSELMIVMLVLYVRTSWIAHFPET